MTQTCVPINGRCASISSPQEIQTTILTLGEVGAHLYRSGDYETVEDDHIEHLVMLLIH